MILLLQIGLGISCRAQLDLSLPIGRLERLDLQPDIGQLCRRIINGDAERGIVQFK
jgi:hypothetical protein